MAREHYREDLTALREGVYALGEDVLDQLRDGVEALAAGDEELARAVEAGDGEINERYLGLEADCIDLFALQQPVASDLRLVAGSYKVCTDLERVGDLAANLAGYARSGGEHRLDPVDVRAIGDETVALVEAALDAYEQGDPAACRAVADREADLDALCQRAGERVVRDLLERSARAGESDASDAFAVEPLMEDVSRALLTVRDLERVGDHAVNVAARTLYVVENDPALI
jgi:phosphate transport system protein